MAKKPWKPISCAVFSLLSGSGIGETDELTTTLVVAYHQDGIQAAIGPCVKICHNQCILSPQRSISNYGKKKVTTDELFETVDGWLANFEVNMNEDIARIQRLKRRIIPMEEIYLYIGLLTALRVSHDSSDRNLSSTVETYPLNQSQISIFTEEVLKLAMSKGQITAWDLYNVATEIYKPGKTDFRPLFHRTEPWRNSCFPVSLKRWKYRMPFR